MTAKKIAVLLADDHGVVREGLSRIIGGEPDMEVVGEAANGRAAAEEVERLQPDVVLMDVSMPELNGVEAARRLSKSVPRTRIIALSMHGDGVYVREILRAGASGYLTKDRGHAELLTAIRAVAAGQSYLSPNIAETVLNDYRKQVTNPIDLLSGREREILQMLAEGRTNKEVAAKLNISVYTVDAHRGRIMDKLNLHSVGELVRFAMRGGLID